MLFTVNWWLSIQGSENSAQLMSFFFLALCYVHIDLIILAINCALTLLCILSTWLYGRWFNKNIFYSFRYKVWTLQLSTKFDFLFNPVYKFAAYLYNFIPVLPSFHLCDNNHIQHNSKAMQTFTDMFVTWNIPDKRIKMAQSNVTV